MEENTVELFDYLRVIWKRKILIIVVTLVGIGVGVGVGVGVGGSRSKPHLLVKYRAEVVLKIGKKVSVKPFGGTPSSDYIEHPENLVIIIPLKYWPDVKGASRYHLDVEPIGSLGMLRIIVEGHDKGIEKSLKGLVDVLIDEHHALAEISVIAYKKFMKKLEVDVENIKKDIVIIDASLREMREKEAEYLLKVDKIDEKERIGGDRSAFLNMLYLKTIDKEKDLSNRRSTLINIQSQLLIHRITLGNLKEYKTEKFGEMKYTAIKPKVLKRGKGMGSTIAVAGIVGLIMSLFIAFFIEYIEESTSRRKGNSKVDSA
tara:strand:- start:167 stop:1114 length:948 start_codon:yes stop_codon:yes gene_type:complete